MNSTVSSLYGVVTIALFLAFAQNSVLPADEPSAYTVVKVAAISFVPVKFNVTGNADRLEAMYRKASAGGAQLAIAPEGALEGYVVNEIIAGKVRPERMHDVAVTIDAPVIQQFQQLARELKMCLVFGFAERIGDDVFNSAVFINDKGTICGKYHKMQLAEGYHESWWFNRLGRHSRAFDTPFGRCGIMICNDRWNAQLAKIPTLDGAQFLVIPSFGSRSVAQDEAVLSRGRENSVPIVEANVGVTLVVNDGRLVAVDRAEEGITFGEISIAPPRGVDVNERDRVETQFLEWRRKEMSERYRKTQKRLHDKTGRSFHSANGKNRTRLVVSLGTVGASIYSDFRILQEIDGLLNRFMV